MSGIVLPQQVGVSVEQGPGPNAFPFTFMMQQPGAVKFLAVGGMSKRLMVAAMCGPLAATLTVDVQTDHAWESEAFRLADALIAFEEKQPAKVAT